MNWRIISCCLLSLSLCLGLSAVGHAQKIPGKDDPAFASALETWLQDEDETALPILAELAQEGNVAARLLVGLIDKKSSLQGPWIALLSKKERISLLRTEGGLSGTSWLRQVDGVESITLWLDILDSKADIETALRLAELGEERLTRAGLIALEARQETGFADYSEDARFPVETRYLIWREWQKNGKFVDVSDALDGLESGSPQRDLLRENVTIAEREKWLLASNIALPLKVLCRQNCADSEGACLRAGLYTLGGYRRYVTQGTPLEALISETDFAESLRGQRGVLRRALTYAFLSESRLKPIAKIDACFAQQLADEGQNF